MLDLFDSGSVHHPSGRIGRPVRSGKSRNTVQEGRQASLALAFLEPFFGSRSSHLHSPQNFVFSQISSKMVETQAQTPKGRLSSVDHHPQDAIVHSLGSPPSIIPQNRTSDIPQNSSSQPPSRSPSPSPHKTTDSRHLQRTIDNYFQSPSLDRQLYDEARMHGDDVSTPTQSTAPSECDSQDSNERNFRGLKPPEPKRRRTSTNRRAVGERDDGLCNLASPPPSLCEYSNLNF